MAGGNPPDGPSPRPTVADMVPSERKDVVELWKDRTEKAISNAEPSWQQFAHNYQVYRGKNHPNYKTSERQGRSQLYVPHAYSQVEQMAPRMIEFDPDWDVAPETHSGVYADLASLPDEETNRRVKVALADQFIRDGFVGKQASIVKPFLIYGLTVTKQAWGFAERERNVLLKRSLMQKLMGVPARQRRIVRTMDDPTMIPVSVFDFAWDPAATSMRDAGYVAQRFYISPSKLRKMAQLGIYDEAEVRRLLDDMPNPGERPGGKDQQRPGESEDQARARRTGYEGWELWFEDRLIVVVEDQYLLRDVPNPYDHGQIPFCASGSQPDMESFVGIGEVEVMDPVQQYIWTIENLRIDYSKYVLNPILLIDRALKSANNYTMRSAARWFVQRSGQIEQLHLENMTAPGWDEVQAAMGYLQQITGVSPYMAGADTTSHGVDQNTATGITLLQQEASKRMQLKLGVLQDHYSRAGEQFLAMDQQFIDDVRYIRVPTRAGEKYLAITPDDFAGCYRVKALGASESTNKETERRSAAELVMNLTPLHGMQMPDGTTFSIEHGLNKYIETHDLDPDRFYSNTPPPQPAGAGQQGPREQIVTNYKDAPPSIQAQIEQADGFQPASGQERIAAAAAAAAAARPPAMAGVAASVPAPAHHPVPPPHHQPGA